MEDKPINKLLTPDQLCDALEVHLGKEKGTKACRELLEKMKDNPEWRAELNTLSLTVSVFQQTPKCYVPDEVAWRLKKILHLDIAGGKRRGSNA